MQKEQVAAILDEIGTLLELQGENTFRCLAYKNAAREIEQMEGNLAEKVAAGKLSEIPGIGETLQQKITTLVQTGHLPFYEDLKAKIPAGMIDMLRIAGMGPKKVKSLNDELGIESIEQLKKACEEDKISGLKGFGVKTQKKILEGIGFLSKAGGRVRLDQALLLAEQILEELKKSKGIKRIELCGSLRRRKETINDIDVLISSDEAAPLMKRFTSLPGVQQVIVQGETKSSITIAHGEGSDKVVMNADLRVVSDKAFPFALNYFTGSKDHNVAIRGLASGRGLRLNEYELMGPDGAIPCKDEADLYRYFGMDYIPPELREMTGELNAAVDHKLPELVEVNDIQGVFHCHTNWSDGINSLEEMAKAAKDLGLKYFGYADHSPSLTVANGLTPERVRKQHKEIEALGKKIKGIKLFKGIESDILADGRLDYDDDVLATFDYVVASVHSHFNQPRDEMTARIVRAISNPHVTMLGHATGRLLLKREGYAVDLEAVLQAAAKHGTMIEINSHPARLDLDWIHCKRARSLGVMVVINPDAHSTKEIELYRYGVDVARRGWLEKKDVFNTKTAAQVAKVFARE
jgi:DNA polymerase (family 10)